MIRHRIRVTGRVQGVFFRAWTVEQARSLGLAGWVRNRADGSVEAVAEGSSRAVDELIARLHGGPPAARVTAVDVVADDGVEALADFAKRSTE